MNKFVEFTVYGLQFKGNRSSGRRRAERGVASGTASGSLNRVVRCLILAVLLLGANLPAVKAQQQYVFYNETYKYLYNNNGNLGVKNTFDPSCVWTASGTLGTTNNTIQTYTTPQRYLIGSNGYYDNGATVSLGANQSNVWQMRSNLLATYNDYGRTFYLDYNGSAFTIRRNGYNQRFSPYQVNISTVDPTSTNPTISGNDVLSAANTFTYTASGAAYQQGGYTNYRFNNADHFFNGNTAITPAGATISGYNWSISSNADVSASGTTNQGSITVNALPESDEPATITVTVTFTGGTPAVAANTTLTSTKEIIIQGTTPSAPTISVSGTTVTMSTTAAGTTTIRYTLDGTTPTATSGTVYSGAIDLSSSTSSPVTIKAVTVRNGNASDVSTETVTLTLPTPVITVNGSAGTATIDCDITGTTIYYTTNGSEPTTSSSQYSGTLSGLSPMTTIKAIAVKSGWNNSPIASETIRIPSGVSGGVVTLFDYEDHNWSYYSDPECPVRSLSPADVKITYYGDGIVMTGNADYTATSTDFVQPGNSNYEGGAKVNVGGENENTFVYYKTLERGDATQTAWTFSSGNQSSAASRCPYTPIYNPFQVRPTYGARNVDANDFTGWRGFQCWRLKRVSGGAVYSAASGGNALSVGAVVNAETEIYFAPNSEYGMEVDLEAVWARAYLKKGNSGNANAILNYGNLGVERNFMTLTANENYRFNGTQGRRITNVDRAVTISCYYPNGEAPDGTNGVVTGNNNDITLGANTKFENVTLSAAAYTLTTSGHDVIIGRGCTSTNVGTVRGMSDGSTNAVNYTIRLESGTYGTFALIDNTARTFSSTVSTRAVFGSDYDRAKSDNGKLSIAANSTVYGGNAVHVFSSASNRNNLTYDWLIKSGRVQASKSVTDANADESIYIGNSGNNDNTQYMGKRRFTMEGGEMASLAGSLNSYGNNRNTYVVNDGDAVEIRIKGGTIRGSVYGAAAYASATGNRRFIFTGGEVRGWIAGGANGTQSDGGYLYGSTKIYIGGKTNVNSNNSTSVINRAVGGNVFGAGCGYGASSNSGQVTEGTTVVVADEAYVERGVYGGGSYGYTTSTSTLYVSGGHVEGKNGGVSGTSYSASITGGVFGGACQNQGGTVNITMTDGLVEGGVYGGSNATGTISNNVTMQINGGQVGTSSKNANIHGGGYGNATVVSGNVTMTLGASTTATDWVKVYGNVYGGSALGTVSGNATITMNKGEINGNLFGGALGNNTYAAQVTGNVAVTVNSGKVTGAVFGCNDANGTPKGTVTVTINGSDASQGTGNSKVYALQGVYGGGNLAHYNPTTATNGYPKVIVNGCNTSIKEVYGGGNAAAVPQTDVTINGGDIGSVFAGGNGISGTPANVGYQNKLEPTTTNSYGNGTATAKIYGGTIGQVFGGSNAHGVIREGVSVVIDKSQSTANPQCAMIVGEVYGGGNMAESKAASVSIGCTGNIVSGENGHEAHPENIGKTLEGIGSVFGGANQADVTSGHITVNINSGIVANVFGGNNQTGDISGTIQVNIEQTSDACGWYVGNVYGGGNLASYTGSPAVNIKNGTVSHNVFGGGKGNSAVVTGSPAVTIGDANDLHSAIVGGDVYGGGDAAAVTGATSVVYNDANASSSVGRLFGGGNAARVSSTATVTLTNGKVTGGIYGGCNATGSVGAVTVALNGGTVGATGAGNEADVYGGGFGAATTTTGNIGVTLNGATVYGDLYGGSALGSVNASTSNTTTVTLTTATLHGSIFGGGKGDNASLGDGHSDVTATSEGKAIVNINVYDQYLTGIYGGANVRGLVKGDITVNVNANVGATGAGNSLDIFGGGYGANTATNGNVTVNVGAANGSIVPTIYGDIYGGSALGSVNDAVGDLTTVNINNGTIHGDVYGGGLGAATVLPNGYLDPEAPKVEAIEYGTVHVNIGTSGQLSNSVVIDGKVFGCNNLAGTPKGHVYVDVYHTAHTPANSYPSPEPATVAAIADQTAYAISEVYGGGNLAHYSTTLEGASTHVYVHNCDNTIQYVYGGGNAANTQANAVRVDGGRMLYVFGGGNGAGIGNPGANVAGNASVTLGGGIIDYVFGGSNTLGMVNGTTSITFTSPATCTRLIKELYGGGNLAPGGAVNMTLPCGTTGPDIVFGGSKNADIGTEDNHKNINLTIAGGDYSQVFGGNNQGGIIWGNVTLTLVGGTIRDAFGGNNQGGNIKGTITVNVEDAENVSCPLQVDNVYGGGNQAAYTPSSATITSPKVNILHGTVNNAVFGGGLGANAGVTANPQVTIGDAENGSHSATVGATKIGGGSGDGYVFGGGSEAVVHKDGDNSGNTHVILTGNAHVTGNVYGGGNQADVEGNSHVEMR